MKPTDRLRRVQLSNNALMKRQECDKYRDRDQHPQPGNMFRLADAEDAQQQGSDENNRPDPHESEIAPGQFRDMTGDFIKPLLIRRTRINYGSFRRF